eukprot:3158090-Prymnesium_polylepis.1
MPVGQVRRVRVCGRVVAATRRHTQTNKRPAQPALTSALVTRGSSCRLCCLRKQHMRPLLRQSEERFSQIAVGHCEPITRVGAGVGEPVALVHEPSASARLHEGAQDGTHLGIASDGVGAADRHEPCDESKRPYVTETRVARGILRSDPPEHYCAVGSRQLTVTVEVRVGVPTEKHLPRLAIDGVVSRQIPNER